MPTLFRILTVVALIGVLIYGGIYSLATFVDPATRDITV
ncbi:MAG: histidine kinase, partial [Beijerinckiaceae bacterium]|nr:histidine kinase [Beijerinckiaceae bacterium]